jgi:hypothetical protein
MMIPYPSSSPAAVNTTAPQIIVDYTGMIVGSTAVASLGIGGVFVLAKYLKLFRGKGPGKIPNQEEKHTATIEVVDGFAYICVKSSDLEEIKQLLFAFKKHYQVLDYCR